MNKFFFGRDHSLNCSPFFSRSSMGEIQISFPPVQRRYYDMTIHLKYEIYESHWLNST